MDTTWAWIVILVCLLLEGFFSGSEIGVISADQIKLRHDAAKGSRGARMALDMLKNPEWLLSTTLVGTNIAVVTNTTVATALMMDLFGQTGRWYAIGLIAPLIWIFGEIVPKSVFQQRADAVTPRAILFLRFASYLFYPLLAVFTFITGLFTRVFGKPDRNLFTLREEMLTMIQMPAQGSDIHSVEKTMIKRLFDFTETTAYDVMVPLIDVVAIERNATCGEAVSLAGEMAHVRLPVYEQQVNKVVGYLNALELIGVEPNQPIKPHVQTVRFVPTSKNISELLIDFRRDDDAVAVVVDEFGGALGIITIEDVMEEVVEEIEDEYDIKVKPTQWVRRVSSKEFIVSARIEVDTLEREVGLHLPKGKYATLAGFLLEKAGEIPTPGTMIKASGISFTIEQSTPQAITEVRIRL
jgi:CBS domain containing-hemolysin-like protein